jgi:hypothetical protein
MDLLLGALVAGGESVSVNYRATVTHTDAIGIDSTASSPRPASRNRSRGGSTSLPAAHPPRAVVRRSGPDLEFWVGDPIAAGVGVEDPHVVVLPTKGGLHHQMQPPEADVGRDLHSSPNRRLGSAQRHLQPVYGPARRSRIRRRVGIGQQGGPAAEQAQERFHVLDLVGLDRTGRPAQRPFQDCASLGRRIVREPHPVRVDECAVSGSDLVRFVRRPAVLDPAAEVVVDQCGDGVFTPSVPERDRE